MITFKILLLDDDPNNAVGQLSNLLRKYRSDFKADEPTERIDYRTHATEKPVFTGSAAQAEIGLPFCVETYVNNVSDNPNEALALAKQCVSQLLKKNYFDLVLVDEVWGSSTSDKSGHTLLMEHIDAIPELNDDQHLRIAIFSAHFKEENEMASLNQIVDQSITSRSHSTTGRTTYLGKNNSPAFNQLFVNLITNRRKEVVYFRVRKGKNQDFSIWVNDQRISSLTDLMEAVFLGYLKLESLMLLDDGKVSQGEIANKLNDLLKTGDSFAKYLRHRLMVAKKVDEDKDPEFDKPEIGQFVLLFRSRLISDFGLAKERWQELNDAPQGKDFHKYHPRFYKVSFE